VNGHASGRKTPVRATGVPEAVAGHSIDGDPTARRSDVTSPPTASAVSRRDVAASAATRPEGETMRTMSEDEWRTFLSTGSRTGMLASVRADGHPHLAPVWFVLDGDEVCFTTWHTTVKARNLQRDPRASLGVDDPAFPFAFVLVEGNVDVEDLDHDLTTLRTWTTRLASRYVPADRAEEFGARNGVPGERLVRLRVERVVARADIAD
jgi:PPOX class probable F420-dependent enzyme